MQEIDDLFIVKIFGEVIAAADAALFPLINKHLLYEYGRSIQIMKQLQLRNDAIKAETKNGKYPLVALYQPFREMNTTGYYANVKIQRFTIATLTTSTDPVTKRYEETFPILYQIWKEIKRQLVRHPNIVGNDPGAIQFDGKSDLPGIDPISDGIKGVTNNDYVDALIIEGLQLTFKTVNNCKKLKSVQS